MTVKVGESALALFRAENRSGHATAGTATFNVTPLKAGQYFNKVQCFCFTEQQLAAGASIDMPVSFFVDPAIVDDPNLREVKTITLSYTFFPDQQAADEQQLGGLMAPAAGAGRSEEHTSELQSLMRTSYAVFCLKKKRQTKKKKKAHR